MKDTSASHSMIPLIPAKAGTQSVARSGLKAFIGDGALIYGVGSLEPCFRREERVFL
jgi:hypothetical protein